MAIQISIFLENKTGHLQRITSFLREVNVNIRTMTLSHSSQGWGILSLIVSNPELAYNTLIDNKIPATKREIVVVEMDDRPGGLDDLLKVIASAGINFTNAYGRTLESGKKAYLAIDVEDINRSIEKLTEAGLKLVSDDEVYGNGKHTE